MNDQPELQELDPRDLSKEELIQALLELQTFAQQLEAAQRSYQQALAQQSDAVTQLQEALAKSNGRLSNLAAALVDTEALSEFLVQSYAAFVTEEGQDTGAMLDKVRPLLRLTAGVVGHHLLKIIIGSEGNLTRGS